MKTLPSNFYTMPEAATMTMNKKELRELLLSTGGRVLACGRSYDIISKHLGVGAYQVFLKGRR